MYAAATAKSLQSWPTLCNPIDGSLPGSSVHGIFQARVLEWVPSPSPLSMYSGCQYIDSCDVPSSPSSSLFRLSVQFSSVTQSCPTLCDPVNRSTPGLPGHHQLLDLTQTHVHQVSDAIQLSHPLSSPSSPAPNPSQHQSLFQ